MKTVGGIPIPELRGLVKADVKYRAPRYFHGFLRATDGGQVPVSVTKAEDALVFQAGRETIGRLDKVNGHYGGSLVEGGEDLIAFHVSGNGIVVVTLEVANKYRKAVEKEAVSSIEELAASLEAGGNADSSVADRFRKA